ncbi:GcrA family cell cycle regulator [Parvularcula dongshanensis]|uniref:GcrA cell cycle regulator n=1 Tax=Parvularcula dongshanensis TaxID=1173995 RepID=A0A840HYI6_9PROT|nr:GcrA family cell cycle regulator [Parvularcula dongshanensis]MBB4657906.1 GcrA cell cycle regulator [Parvularcula dongshanensis]
MAWTEERVEVLKTLWSEGLSASQIAGRLGGVTRNAVIGKVHRLGLSGRAAPAAPKPMAPKEPAPEPKVRTVSMDPATFGEGRMTVSTIGTNQCKWPIGDPASEEFHFCGQGAASGKPYCAYHSSLAFQPNSARRERVRTKAPAAIAAPKRAYN